MASNMEFRKDGRTRVARVKDRLAIFQIKISLEQSKGFGTHSRMYRKPLESFKQGSLYQGS